MLDFNKIEVFQMNTEVPDEKDIIIKFRGIKSLSDLISELTIMSTIQKMKEGCKEISSLEPVEYSDNTGIEDSSDEDDAALINAAKETVNNMDDNAIQEAILENEDAENASTDTFSNGSADNPAHESVSVTNNTITTADENTVNAEPAYINDMPANAGTARDTGNNSTVNPTAEFVKYATVYKNKKSYPNILEKSKTEFYEILKNNNIPYKVIERKSSYDIVETKATELLKEFMQL